MGWNLDGLREVWKQPFICNSCSYPITFITLSSALVLLTDQTDRGKNLPKTILRNTPESNKYFCFRVYHFVQTTIFSKNVKTTVLTTLHCILFASYNITDITYTNTHYSKNSIFISLTFLALKYKLTTEEKLRKWCKSKASIQKMIKAVSDNLNLICCLFPFNFFDSHPLSCIICQNLGCGNLL